MELVYRCEGCELGFGSEELLLEHQPCPGPEAPPPPAAAPSEAHVGEEVQKLVPCTSVVENLPANVGDTS